MENLDNLEAVVAAPVVAAPVVAAPVVAAKIMLVTECTRDNDCKVIDCENCA